jgi:hypothetical protein
MKQPMWSPPPQQGSDGSSRPDSLVLSDNDFRSWGELGVTFQSRTLASRRRHWLRKDLTGGTRGPNKRTQVAPLNVVDLS